MATVMKAVSPLFGTGAADAAAAGAQLYITGDVRYHDARRAEEKGIGLLDVGHFAPESYGVRKFGELLGQTLAGLGLEVQLLYAKEKDPFLTVS